MDIQIYLDRIGYHGPLTPTAETLRALQVAHLQTVPFENLSIHARQPIVMKLITTQGGERQVRVLGSEEERAGVLREMFGVVV